MIRKTMLTLLVLASLVAVSMVFAQDDPVATEEAMMEEGGEMMMDAMASGLLNPRHMTFGADGTLYIAEAGSGGDTVALDARENEVMVGLTSQVTAVAPDGTASVVLDEQWSRAGFGNFVGVSGVVVTDTSLWVTQGEGVPEVPFEEAVVEAIAEYDLATGEMLQMVDIGSFEEENNPDGEIVASNPTDLAVGPDGTVYVVDASANTLLTWTPDAGVALFGVWPAEEETSQVPDAVAVGPNGDVYVGFLSGFPFTTGSAKVERWSADGELIETYGDLTGVVDVMVAEDGTVYALELASGFGDTGWIAESGSVKIVSAEGNTVVAEGLNFPGGMVMAEDGTIYVSVNSAFSEPGTGEVIAVGGM